MHAVILAAGMGTRLPSSVPKPLVEIAPGRTLIGNQIAILERLVGADRIVLVLGHRAMEIVAAHPHLMYVYNERYASTNTGKSLLCALRRLDDEVLWANGDVYVEERTMRRLIETHAGCSRTLVNGAETGDEEVKYTLREDGSIAELSKEVRRAAGESLGVQIVRRADRAELVRGLEAAADQDFFEKALEVGTLSGAIRLMPVDVGDDFCREVDDAEDLDAVRRYLAERGEA